MAIFGEASGYGSYWGQSLDKDVLTYRGVFGGVEGLEDGAFGQATPVPSAVTPPSPPGLLDSLGLSSLLSSPWIFIIGGAILLYVYRDKIFIGESVVKY